MKYSEYQATADYGDSQPGAAIRIVIYKASDPSQALIARQTGINADDNFEQLPVEESGSSGVDEHGTGRHNAAFTTNGFFSPEKNDKLPSRQDFLGDGSGEEYTVMQVKADDRIGAGIPINVWVGCKITRYNFQQGARGLLTFDMAFVCTRRYNGAQWAALSGNA